MVRKETVGEEEGRGGEGRPELREIRKRRRRS